jgi:nitrite reductase/ring-hydroxylating ferredoxin subunit
LEEDWIRVAGIDDVPVGEAARIEIMGLNLALYNVDGAFYCTDNVCSHAYALLSEGWLEGHLIECPLHNGQFDVRTGEGQGSPITEDIRSYRVKIDGEDILIRLPE